MIFSFQLKLLMYFHFKQVAKATLALFVDQVFTLVEVAFRVLGLFNYFSLRNSNLLAIKGDDDILRWICKQHRQSNISPLKYCSAEKPFRFDLSDLYCLFVFLLPRKSLCCTTTVSKKKNYLFFQIGYLTSCMIPKCDKFFNAC